jgi:hypothetical protein
MRDIFLTFALIMALIGSVAVQGQASAAASTTSASWDLSPKDKERIEAGIRKQLPSPASVVFSDWTYRPVSNPGLVGQGFVTVETPSKYGTSQGVLRESWQFILKQNGSIALSRLSSKVNTAIPFLEICKTGNYEQIKAAVDSGVNVYAKDKNGDTALHIAARQNFDPRTLELLFVPGHCFRVDEATQAVNIYKKNKGNKESIRYLQNYISGCTAGPDGDGH